MQINQITNFINDFINQDEREGKKSETIRYASAQWISKVETLIKGIKRDCTDEHITHFQALIEEDKENVQLKISAAKGNLLHSLAKSGKPIQFVKILAQHGASFDELDDWGNTPLLWSIANANNEMALEILNYQQNINAQDSLFSQNTALHLAIAKGYQNMSQDGQRLKVSNLKLVKRMVELGADVNVQNGNGNTPLHLACLRRDILMVESILAKNPNIQSLNKEGKTPLQMLQKTYGEALKIFEETSGRACLLKKGDFEAGKKDIQTKLAAYEK